MPPWISISSGVDGQGVVPCLSFPYLQNLGKPPNVSEDNFLELRGVNRENQAGLGQGPEKCCVRQEGGERGPRGLWPRGLEAGVRDFTFQEMGFWSKGGRLVVPAGRTRVGGVRLASPERYWRTTSQFSARGSQCRESWAISRLQGLPPLIRRFQHGQS